MVRGEEEFDVAYAEMAKTRVSAVIVQGSLPRQRAVPSISCFSAARMTGVGRRTKPLARYGGCAQAAVSE